MAQDNRNKRSSKHQPSSSGLVFSTNPEVMSTLQSIDLGPVETEPLERQPLRVRIETKARKGKIVTLVEGFKGTESDLKSLGKELKAAMGVGGSVKDGAIIIQGDRADDVLHWLINAGYTKSRKY